MRERLVVDVSLMMLLLIPIGLALLGAAIAAFVWAVRHDQFDELDGITPGQPGEERRH